MVEKLKQRKYIALLFIAVLVVGIISLVSFGRPDKYAGLVKVKNVGLSSKVLSSVADADGTISKSYDEIDYTVNYTLDPVEGITKRDVLIRADLTDEEFRYARFKSVSNSKYTSTIIDDGKSIEIEAHDVDLGVEQRVGLRIVIENAPNNTSIKPTIKIKEATGEFTSATTAPIVVHTKSLSGTVTDDKDTKIPNIELSLYEGNIEIKRTYTDDNGNYSFTDITSGSYKVKVEEEIYEVTDSKEVLVDEETTLNIKVKRVEPYSIETHKYIERMDLIVDGKEQHYTYEDAEKVLETIKKANEIKGEIEYKLVVKNVGEKTGTISRIEDEPSEGLKLKEGNTGWEESNGKFYFRPYEGTSLNAGQYLEIALVLEIEKTNEAKTYLNKLTAKGEIYENVVYLINGQKYKEETVLQGEKITRPEVTIDNLDGWYTDANYTNKYNFNNPVNKDLILYAYNNEAKCTVTFMDFGTVYDQKEITCGKTVTKPTDPSHVGYDFNYWEYNNREFDFDTEINNDIILESNNDLIDYQITYKLNGGALEEGKTNPPSYNVETPTFTLYNPSKLGYRFVGWTEHDGDTPTITMTIPKGTTGKKEFTANYVVIDYNITYNLVGGSLEEGKTNPPTYNIETEDFTLNNPSKEGYTFLGWIGTNLDEATKTVTIEQGTTGDLTFTATYKPKKYSISYSGITEEEIDALSNPKEYTIETPDITLVNPSNRIDGDGDVSEIFVGWTGTDIDNQTTSVVIPQGSKGNREYEAHFIAADPDVYPITYNLNGGSLADGVSNPESYTKKTETFTLNNPNKNGYTFTGWTGTDVATESTTVTVEKGSRGAREYEAHYTPIEYTITYNLDGGSLADGVSNPTTYTIETEDFTLNNPSKLGYTFIGWVGTDVPTENTSVSIAKGSTGNRTYTAKYTKDKYIITYNLDGGSLPEGESNPTEYYIDSNEITLVNPSKDDYTFTGWTGTGLTELTQTVTIPTGSTGDREYTAHYTPIEYTITYDLDGGSLPEDVTNPIKYTVETETFTLNNPSKNNYRFTGWTGTDLSVISPTVTIPKGSRGDREYTANYGDNKYTVRFINDGSLYQTQVVAFANTATKPTDPTKEKNVFRYWSLENKPYSENPEEWYFARPVLEDITLYAIYEPIEAPTVVHTPTEWTNQNVTVTITPAHEEYNTFYYVGSSSSTDYTGPFIVEENTTIAAISNYNGVYSETTLHPITNIDKVNPIINNISASSITSNQFTINVSAIDYESGIRSLTIYKDNEIVGTYVYDEEDTSEKIKSITLTDLEESHTYLIKAVATDRAGNVSDAVEKNVETGEPIVARIIGEDGSLWEEENYINFSSLQAAIEYEDCVSTQCTIQMVTGTNESNTILNGQDITLDLNGQMVSGVNSSYTIDNYGLFTLVDNNQESNGVLYNTEGTAIKNSREDAVLTLGVNDEEVNISTTKPRVVGKTEGVNKELGTFNFYDGYIEGENAINGIVDDTPYLYNARVSSLVNPDLYIKQKAVLSKVADAEARIGSTYYTRLGDAIEQSNIGDIDIEVEMTTLVESIQTPGDYGFYYNGTSIVPDEDHMSQSYSIIPIDLTDAQGGRILSLAYKAHNYEVHEEETETGTINHYVLPMGGTIGLTDDPESFTFDALAYYSHVSTTIYTYSSGEVPESETELKRTLYNLESGKKYLLILGGNVEIIDVSVGTNEIKPITQAVDYNITHGGVDFGFDYDPDTQTFRSTNNFKAGTVAFSQIEVDLTTAAVDHEVSLTASLDTYGSRYDYGIVKVTTTPDRPEYYYNDNLVYQYGAYYYPGIFTGPRRDFGPFTYTKTLTKGQKYYIQFVYWKNADNIPEEVYREAGCNDEFVINNLDVHPIFEAEQTFSLLDDFVSYNDDGTNLSYSSYYNAYQKSSMTTNQVADYFVPIDLTNKAVDYLLTINHYSNSSSFDYMYLTDNDKNVPFEELNANKDRCILFIQYNQLYDMNGSSTTNIYDTNVRLEAGKKYYFHYATKCTTGSCSGPEWGQVKLKPAPVTPTTIITGRTYVNHGTEGMPNYTHVDEDDHTLRYIENTPNNYVSFNDELWRIIGVFNVEDENGDVKPRVKIVRASSIGTYDWDTHIAGQYGTGTNDWSQSDLMMNLNPGFEENNIENPTVNLEKYSHTSNINDSGTQTSNYGSYWNDTNITGTDRGDTSKAHVVSFPGATRLHVKIYYGGESSSYDWVCMWEGSHPEYNASNNYSSSLTGKIGGGSHTSASNFKEYFVTGDSVTFSFRSDSGGYGDGYGYYAIVSDPDAVPPTSANVNNSLYWNRQSGYCYKGTTSIGQCSFSETGIKEEYRSYISNVNWNVGMKYDTTSTSLSELVTNEQSATWLGRVGLTTMSDVFYASGDYKPKGSSTPTRESCLENGMGDGSCLTTNNWYYNLLRNNTAWTITGSSIDPPANYVHAYPYSSGSTASTIIPSTYNYSVFPVVYLDTKINITSGAGTSKEPYIITLGESDNEEIDNYYGLVPEEEEDEGPTIGYISSKTDDYKKAKNLKFYGFTYDELTNTFTNDNVNDFGSIANTTVEIDMTNETVMKRMYYERSSGYTYDSFFVVNENPEPMYIPHRYNSSSSSIYGYIPYCYGSNAFNCNNMDLSNTYELQPGKKYYVHMAYVNYRSETNYNNIFNVKIRLDDGDFVDDNVIKQVNYDRNDEIDTVQVLKDINLNYPLNIEENRSVILDLNGYTLTSMINGNLVRNKGELEIIDTKVGVSPGKIVNNNYNTLINNKGANLKLTSGELQTSGTGVQNIGTMAIGEDFKITGTNYGIDNDGTITDLKGDITGGYGVRNNGSIATITGPVKITGTNGYAINNISSISGATLTARGNGIESPSALTMNVSNTSITTTNSGYGIKAPLAKNVSVTDSNISASGTAINTPAAESITVNNTEISTGYIGINTPLAENTDIEDVTITNGSLGINAKSYDTLKNVSITNNGLAIKGEMDKDTTVIDNVDTDSNIALFLTDGSIEITDDLDFTFTGGFINKDGDMTIDISDKNITKGITRGGSYADYYSPIYMCNNDSENTYNIINNGTMTINSLAEENNINVLNGPNGDLTGDGYNQNIFLTCGDSNSTLTNVNTNLLHPSGYDFDSFSSISYEGGNINKVFNTYIDYDNHTDISGDYSLRSHLHNMASVYIKDATIGTSTTTDAIVNRGWLTINNSTVLGIAKNYTYGDMDLVNSSLTTLDNDAYITLRYKMLRDYEYYTYNEPASFSATGSTIGSIMNSNDVTLNGSTVTGSTSNYSRATLTNNSSTTGTVSNSGIYNNVSGTLGTVSNSGTFVMGDKETPVGAENPTANTVNNNGDLKFFDGMVTSTNEYPINGGGSISEIAEGYDIVKDHVDDQYRMYLSNDEAVCQIGDVTYPSIAAAIASIENSETQVEIEVLKSHITANPIVNDKNVILDLNGYTINTYSGTFIENNGTMNITSTGDSGIIQYTSAVSGSSSQVRNNGTMNYNNIISKTVLVHNSENSYFNIDLSTIYELDNYGDAVVDTTSVKYIINHKNIDVISNVAQTISDYTTFTNYNSRKSEDDDNSVIIRSGYYNYIYQYIQDSPTYDQSIIIGTDNTEVTVREMVNLNQVALTMKNTNINAASFYSYKTYSYALRVTGTSQSTADNLNINTSIGGSSKTYYGIINTGPLILNNSNVSCNNSYSSYSRYCNGINVGAAVTLNNTTLTGYNGFTAIDNNRNNIELNNSTITASNYGINTAGNVVSNNTDFSGSMIFYNISDLEVNGGTITSTTSIFRSITKLLVDGGNFTSNDMIFDLRQTTTENLSIMNGTFTPRNYFAYYPSTSSTYMYEKTINIGTNKEHTMLGNPTITSNRYGIYGATALIVYMANGSLTASNSAINLSESTSSHYNKVYVGTISVENENPNPTITSTGSDAIYFYTYTSTDNVLDVYKGNITGYTSGINQSNGKITMNIGNTNDSDVSKVNPSITGQTTSGITVVNSTNATFRFYDGVVTGPTGNAIIGNITTIEPNYMLVTDQLEGSMEKRYLDTPKIVEVNGVEYNLLQEAIDAASNGDTIKVLIDFTNVDSLGTAVIPADKSLILDYNNNTITNKAVIPMIENNGSLEIKNASNGTTPTIIDNKGTLVFDNGNGIHIVNEENATATIHEGTRLSIDNAGTLNIDDGSFTSINNTGTMEMTDGTITTLTTSGTAIISTGTITTVTLTAGTVNTTDVTHGTLNINGGTYNLPAGSVTNVVNMNSGTLNIGVKDGNVSTTDPYIGTAGNIGIKYNNISSVVNFYDGAITGLSKSNEGSFFNEVETGYVAVENNGITTLTTNNIIYNETKDIYYNTVQGAIDASAPGDKLVLLANIIPSTEEGSFVVGNDKNITFDFNRFNIMSRTTQFTNNGTLNIVTGTEYPDANRLYFLSVTNNASLDIDGINASNMTIINNTTGTANIENSKAQVIGIENAGTLTAASLTNTDGHIYNDGTSTYTTSTLNGSIQNRAGTLDLNSCTVGSFSTSGGATTNVNGGSVTGSRSNYGTLNVDGANFRGSVTNLGTLNLKNLNDTTSASSLISVTSEGTTNVESSNLVSITIKQDCTIKDSVLGEYGNIEADNVTIDNSTVQLVKVRETGTITQGSINNYYMLGSSTSTISNNSSINNMYIQNSDITIQSSSVNNIEMSSDNYTSNITATDSTIGTIANIRGYSYVNLTLTNTNTTGDLNVYNVTIDGGIINSNIVVNSTISQSTGLSGGYDRYEASHYVNSCSINGATVTGNLSCTEVEIEDSTITGDVSNTKSSADAGIIINNSTVTGNVSTVKAWNQEHNKEHVIYIEDSTINGTVTGGVDTYIKNSDINDYVSGDIITILSGSVTTTSEENPAITATDSLIIGTDDNTVVVDNPTITGNILGINAQKIYYYDGKIIGTSAMSGMLYGIAGNYKTNIINVDGKQVVSLERIGIDEVVAETDNKFYADLQAAVNSCVDGGTVKLHRDVTLSDTLVISEGKSIIIDLNNHQIVNQEYISGDYTIIDSTNPNLDGSIYKFYADVSSTDNAYKNVIIYQMEDGNALDSTETYKLYQLIDGQYKIVRLDEEELGMYTVSGSTETLRTLKGKLYLNGLGAGSYKLVSNTNREIDFTVDYDSVSPNVRENGSSPDAKVVSTSVATVILTFATGVMRTPWIIFILIVLALIITGIVVVNNKNKKKEVI